MSNFPITSQAPIEVLYAAPTSTQMATIGQVVEDEFGGRWRYCKAGAAILIPLLAVGAYKQPTDCTPSATAVGSFTLAITGSGDASCTKDQYKGGSIIVYASATSRFYMIIGNTASSTTTTTLTLASPVLVAVAGTEWATINPCPYADVRIMAGNYMSAVCMPFQAVASGYYFWGKTRGLAYGVVASTVPGAAANDRLLVFTSAGALEMFDEACNTEGVSRQIAGYLLPRTGSTYGGGDQSFMLMLE